MANILKTEKKVAVISMLAEGASIRAVERITGVNQNTIMSLNRRVGDACAKIMDEKMRGLNCKQIWKLTRFGDSSAQSKITPSAPGLMAMSGRSSHWTPIHEADSVFHCRQA